MRTEITVLKVEPEVPEEDDVFLGPDGPFDFVGIEYGRAHEIILILAGMTSLMAAPQEKKELILSAIPDIVLGLRAVSDHVAS